MKKKAPVRSAAKAAGHTTTAAWDNRQRAFARVHATALILFPFLLDTIRTTVAIAQKGVELQRFCPSCATFRVSGFVSVCCVCTLLMGNDLNLGIWGLDEYVTRVTCSSKSWEPVVCDVLGFGLCVCVCVCVML
jgi:hypothetical protein